MDVQIKTTFDRQEIFIEKLPYWTRICVTEDDKPVEFLLDWEGHNPGVVENNIYRGIIKDVVPSMQAVFIDIGSRRNAYLFVPSPLKMQSYREGEPIMVQVKKEEIDSKGAKVTDNPTIPGKYVVLTFEDKIGISKKIKSKYERKRLKKLLQRLKKIAENSGYTVGIVARTDAQNASDELIEKDFERIFKVFVQIKARFEMEKGPVLLWSDTDIIKRAFRDYATSKLQKVYVNSKELVDKIKEEIEIFVPSIADKVQIEYVEEPFLFDKFGIEKEFQQALKDEIEIEGGIRLIFNELEAFTAIDVNTASFTGEETGNIDTTALKANIIAMREIARQIRLRHLGGIIIVDLIDIKNPSLKKKLIDTIKMLFATDRYKAKVFGLTRLGLVEITRRKSGYSLKRMLTEKCRCCGNGYVWKDILKFHNLLLEIYKRVKNMKEKTPQIKVAPEDFKKIEEYAKKIGLDIKINPKYGVARGKFEI